MIHYCISYNHNRDNICNHNNNNTYYIIYYRIGTMVTVANVGDSRVVLGYQKEILKNTEKILNSQNEILNNERDVEKIKLELGR